MDTETIRSEALRRGQGQLFTFWDQLGETQRRELLDDVAQIDLDTLDRLIPTHVKSTPSSELGGTPEPANARPARPRAPGLV